MDKNRIGMKNLKNFKKGYDPRRRIAKKGDISLKTRIKRQLEKRIDEFFDDEYIKEHCKRHPLLKVFKNSTNKDGKQTVADYFIYGLFDDALRGSFKNRELLLKMTGDLKDGAPDVVTTINLEANIDEMNAEQLKEYTDKLDAFINARKGK